MKIRAFDDRVLPADTAVTVEYGGDGHETYEISGTVKQPQVLFCSPSGGQAGAAGSAGEAGAGGGAGGAGSGGAGAGGAGGQEAAEARLLVCELWTDGAANVEVEASGLSPYRDALAATTDECGVATSLMEIQLMAPVVPDGGSL